MKKTTRLYLFILINLIIAAALIGGASKPRTAHSAALSSLTQFDNGTYVTYYLPYLHTNTNNPTYCVFSNFGTDADNVTKIGFTVTGNSRGSVDGSSIFVVSGPITNAGTFKKTSMITFSGQSIYVGTSDTNQVPFLSTYVGTSESYGLKLTFISSIKKSSGVAADFTDLYGTARQASNRDSHLNCKSIVMSCFQGTTTPMRNIGGYSCEAGFVLGNSQVDGLRPYNISVEHFGWYGAESYDNNSRYKDNVTGYTY
ncbi:MAG: hypothetical protein H7844_02910 [Nitrospirae bacterium YQR-1]